MISIDDMAVFCKKKGFVYADSDIYGGMAGFWDYGPLGVALFYNIKLSWWKYFVQDREDMVGIDASIISNPRVWKASGHLDNFGDIVLACSKCGSKMRADHFVQEKTGKNVEGMKAGELNKIIVDSGLKCPKCNSAFQELRDFNLLFRTHVGAAEGKTAEAYLRGETAQGMFTNFKLITDTARQKIPFGIAQVGKCFRNEISPRDFMFRSREFTIGEFEYFIKPGSESPILDNEHKSVKVMLLDAEAQEKGSDQLKETTIGKMVEEGRLTGWHGYWLAEQVMWFMSIGLPMRKIKIREHMKKELSHYSSATFDLDFEYPFGSKEFAGNANRGDYDLGQHAKESGQSMEVFDDETKSKFVPHVIEPTFGMDRIFMSVLVDAYHHDPEDKERDWVVLKLNPTLAPYKVAVFPLVNKLEDKAREVYASVRKEFPSMFDRSGAIGRRYARADEIGIPWCVTVDFQTLEDGTVTIRDRDTTEQRRIPMSKLKEEIASLIRGKRD